MKCELKSDFPVDDKACKAATGRSLAEWYALLDAADGVKLGRRNINSKLSEEYKVEPWWATTISVEYEKHSGQRKKDGLYEGYFICSTKTITAPHTEVYRALSDEALLSKWFGAKTKARVEDGGSFENADGDRGTYLRVRPDKDLRFTWENPACPAASLVDVSVADKGKGKTYLLVNHTRIQTRAEADGLRIAWAGAIDELKKLVEA
jgi:uncharacterized protein YndB with AHSA1/START domain